MWVISRLCWICVCVGASLFANWNDSFDEQTQALIEISSPFQEEIYKSSYEDFRRIRSSLDKDLALKKLFGSLGAEEKMVLPKPRDGFLLKKRQNDRIHELYAWEVSFLLDNDPSVIAAFPISIEGKKIIVQKMEPFFLGKGKNENHPSHEVKKVSLEEYWKAHLKAYLLGLGDLLGRNIGIDPRGKIRFFDAEYCFSYKNRPHPSGKGAMIGFRAASMEWPQYRMPLDRQTAKSLKEFVLAISHLEEKWLVYEQLRGVSLFPQGAYERLEHVRTFAVQEGTTFRDFIGFIYPEIDSGLDQLKEIVSQIYHRNVDHGDALIFLSQHIYKEKYKLSVETQRALQEWMQYYLPE